MMSSRLASASFHRLKFNVNHWMLFIKKYFLEQQQHQLSLSLCTVKDKLTWCSADLPMEISASSHVLEHLGHLFLLDVLHLQSDGSIVILERRSYEVHSLDRRSNPHVNSHSSFELLKSPKDIRLK